MQEVTDEQGRRRFHGAFTGGFSAGFYNTVGSAEGWAPSSFK
jgi:G patch domain-containing protein 1